MSFSHDGQGSLCNALKKIFERVAALVEKHKTNANRERVLPKLSETKQNERKKAAMRSHFESAAKGRYTV